MSRARARHVDSRLTLVAAVHAVSFHCCQLCLRGFSEDLLLLEAFCSLGAGVGGCGEPRGAVRRNTMTLSSYTLKVCTLKTINFREIKGEEEKELGSPRLTP